MFRETKIGDASDFPHRGDNRFHRIHFPAILILFLLPPRLTSRLFQLRALTLDLRL